jgi:hypothetical protein
MNYSDADELLAASSVTLLEAKSKNVPDAFSFPRRGLGHMVIKPWQHPAKN